MGRSSHELLQTDHPLGMAQIDALLERDGQWKGELTQTTKDGRKLIVEGQWTVAVDAQGNKTVLEANRDITERKRAEAENLLLATAIEQAAETVVITDRDAKIQYVNPAFTRTTGYTRGEAIGQNPRILKSGQHDAKFYQEMWATLTAGKLWRGEFTNRRKDGTLYMEEATIAPVRDASGEITNYIAIKSDITERKRGEMALRESEFHYRQLFERSESALGLYEMVFDAQGNPSDFRFLDVNPAFERITGLKRSQILGHTALEVTPGLEEYWIKLFGRVAATGEPAAFEQYTQPLGRYYSGSAYSPRPNQVAVILYGCHRAQTSGRSAPPAQCRTRGARALAHGGAGSRQPGTGSLCALRFARLARSAPRHRWVEPGAAGRLRRASRRARTQVP